MTVPVGILTRAEARMLGLMRYFTGKPCKRGHIAWRAVSNHTCLVCMSESRAEDYARNPEKAKARRAKYFADNRADELKKMRAYAEANRESAAIASRKRYVENIDSLRHKSREWAKNNPEKRMAQHSERKARKNGATPAWYGEFDAFVMREACDLCLLRAKATGIDWHTDHMIPLRARTASGLHCATNFQVIPAVLNMAKKNKMLLTQPLEWLKHI